MINVFNKKTESVDRSKGDLWHQRPLRNQAGNALLARWSTAEGRNVAQGVLALGTPYEKKLMSVIANADMGEENLDISLHEYELLIKKYPEYYDGYAGGVR